MSIHIKLVKTIKTNSVDAFNPTIWAQESLMVLEQSVVAANLVHKDFNSEIKDLGDTVSTRRPAKFTAARKGPNDNVAVQDATATNVSVVLNQQLHTSFLIRDTEQSKSMADLVATYLVPAVKSLARQMDLIVLGQIPRFNVNAQGKLGTALTKEQIITTRTKMDNLLVPDDGVGRNFILTPIMEGQLLGISEFTNAEKIGDQGTSMREASLGRRMGFDFYKSQLAGSVTSAQAVVTGAVNNGAGYAVGVTAVTVDGFSAAITNGSICTIDGQPYQVASTTGGSTPTVITIASPGLRFAVADNAVVKVTASGTVPAIAAANYGSIALTAGGIVRGQPVSLGSNIYTAIDGSTGATLILDRPNVAASSNADVIGFYPNGEYGFAFHRNALALVSRPLALPRSGLGAMSAIASSDGLGLRVVQTYDGNKQGTLVTVDLLCGVEVLDVNLGVPVFA